MRADGVDHDGGWRRRLRRWRHKARLGHIGRSTAREVWEKPGQRRGWPEKMAVGGGDAVAGSEGAEEASVGHGGYQKKGGKRDMHSVCS